MVQAKIPSPSRSELTQRQVQPGNHTRPLPDPDQYLPMKASELESLNMSTDQYLEKLLCIKYSYRLELEFLEFTTVCQTDPFWSWNYQAGDKMSNKDITHSVLMGVGNGQ